MPLDINEASSLSLIITHLTGQQHAPGEPVATRRDAIEALVRLAGSARETLLAGRSANEARAELEAYWPGALLDVWMAELHGAEPVPFATEQSARHHVLTEGSWDAGSDLSWRTGKTDDDGRSAKILYCDGTHTLCCIWPARVRFSPLDGAPTIDARDEKTRACKTCGCTEDEPCEGGCAWVTEGTLEIDLCTACAWAIARDAIASGLYQLQPTDGDTLFEARGGLIPQPMLTEAEANALQPLIAEVEAARSDRMKLDEIAERELRKVVTASDDAMKRLMNHAAVPAYFVGVDPAMPGAQQPATAVIATQPFRLVFPAQLPPLSQKQWEEALSAAEKSFFLLPPMKTYEFEYAVNDGGVRGPVMSQQEAEQHMHDLRRLYPDEPPSWALQGREVGPWENVIYRRNDAFRGEKEGLEPVQAISAPPTTLAERDEVAARITAFLDARDASLDAKLAPFGSPRIGPGVLISWHDGERDHLLTADDLRALLATRVRLESEVEQLQVELGYALAPDDEDDFEPLTNRDVDPDAVYATEDDDFDDERAEAYGPTAGYDGEAPF